MQEKLVDTNMAKKLNLLKKLVRLQVDKTLTENRLTEVSANALRSKYEKALKKEQTLSSLLLVNLEKYKAAKAKGDEKAIAKHTKIAGQIGKKKAKATKDASAAYKAYEDKISGLHSDAELEIDEGTLTEALARGLKPLLKLGSKVSWNTMSEDALLDLSEKFEEIDDEDADSIASHLNMSIELRQDGYRGDATKKMKQFNKACADALRGRSVKSAFENVNEASLNSTQKAAAKMNNEVRVIKKAMKNIQKISKDITPKGNNAWGNYILRGINSLLDNFTILETVYQNLISNKEDDAIDSIKRFEIDSINEALTLDGDGNYKYKKYVTKAFHKIHDAMFEFRHAMGVKQIGQDDKEIKKQLDAIHQAVVDLQNKLKSKGLTGGLTEAKLNEMDINDPILIAVRARQTALKKKAALPKVKKISTKQYYKLMDLESDIIDRMKDAAKEYQKLDSEMNQDAGQKGSNWTDADANRYGGDLNKLQTKIEKLAKEKLKVKKAIMSYRIN